MKRGAYVIAIAMARARGARGTRHPRAGAVTAGTIGVVLAHRVTFHGTARAAPALRSRAIVCVCGRGGKAN